MEGERLAELRKNKHLKQEELAKQLGISKSALSKYERNINEPDDKTVRKVAEFFNVSLDYLMGLTREERPLHRTGATLIVLDNLPQAAKDDLLKYIDFLKAKYRI